jgi:uncharacterized protein (DUF486 family)
LHGPADHEASPDGALLNIPFAMKAAYTIGLLILSNAFMTLAWYGHLRFKDFSWGKGLGLFAIILISWGIAFFEYVLQVPANRIGHNEHGGPFTLVQLKVLQEVITLAVFTIFTLFAFRHEVLRWNHALAAVLLVVAVWLVFKK